MLKFLRNVLIYVMVMFKYLKWLSVVFVVVGVWSGVSFEGLVLLVIGWDYWYLINS